MGWLDNVGGNIAGWMHGQDESGFIPPQNQNAWNQGQGKGGTLSYNKQNQLVNEQGELVDRDGNLIDETGNPIEASVDGDKIVNGKDATLKTINNQFNGAANGDEYNQSLVDKYNAQFNGSTNDDIDEDGDGNEFNKGLVNKYNEQFQDDNNEIVDKIDDIKTTDSDDQGGRKRPFKSLFGKIKEGWQNREGGLRNIGSYEEDEDEFIKDKETDEWITNPQFGQAKDKGKGLFGKTGGFMSKFGTGHGALSGLLGGVGKGMSQMGSDMIRGGGHQYGDFYNRDDDRRY